MEIIMMIRFNVNDNDNNNKYNILINGDDGRDDETDQW